jgi:SAM-dependent methyltransferase
VFEVRADAYDRFMGRYSLQLAPQLADLAGVGEGQRVVDVGCGPGALTAELARRVGPTAVAAVDPSEPFVDAARERLPGVDVRLASAESLPFADGAFDAALASLVVHFMRDPAAGLGEMRRVTRSGGVVAASTWDFFGDRSPLWPFWRAARELDPDVNDESREAGSREGQLVELFEAQELGDVQASELTASVEHGSFDEWWEPFTLGVGPAGEHVAALDEDARAELRERCRAQLPPPPFTISAVAFAARGLA